MPGPALIVFSDTFSVPLERMSFRSSCGDTETCKVKVALDLVDDAQDEQLRFGVVSAM